MRHAKGRLVTLGILAFGTVLVSVSVKNTYAAAEPSWREGHAIETRPPELESDRPAFVGQTRAPYHATSPFHVTVLTDRLHAPWSLAFLPDGRMLVTEKPGALRIVDAQGRISGPVRNLPAVHYGGQVGLLDVALDRDFAKDHRIFFSYSEDVGDDKTNIALARATLDEKAGILRDVSVIFRALPAVSSTKGANQGGRIAVAPNGTLFMTVGDRSSITPWDVAQHLDSDLGKIIHITADGEPASDNPFIGRAGARPEIWTLGHRSEEGLAFAPDGRLWETEHGPQGGDELNLIERGKNYGWPLVTHGIDYSGEKINGGLTEKPGTEQARYYWDPVIAPSGLAFYSGNLFPQWHDSVFVGGLRAGFLDRLTLTTNDKVRDEEPLLADLRSRIRDVRSGPDGAVYVLTDDGKLLRLTPGQ
ncbi:glucose sorbosone dehydrogenase [Neoasaia chiangmaiensis NBRC 101099]|nr:MULTISPECIES: PQQ-dependent sugar dehydrogenase [Acetobacteraceae]GBR37179.1 glucose sorbosone dehydrogenase [Neoasaia chiangmaiensis NBRC 101099]GEN16475.1 glucose dehydrogenase [Neoasaia chiangmaiensis]